MAGGAMVILDGLAAVVVPRRLRPSLDRVAGPTAPQGASGSGPLEECAADTRKPTSPPG